MPVTLATLHEATSQQVLNQVANHLLSQNAKSIEPDGFGGDCVYRDDGGLKCAAGCLISDEEYDPQMEGVRWCGLVARGVVPPEHEELIVELQKVHDEVHPRHWRKYLLDIAQQRGLFLDVVEPVH